MPKRSNNDEFLQGAVNVSGWKDKTMPVIIPVPSRKLNVKGYPVNWAEIATAVKEWAGWHCVPCGGMINIADTVTIRLPGTLSRFSTWMVSRRTVSGVTWLHCASDAICISRRFMFRVSCSYHSMTRQPG